MGKESIDKAIKKRFLMKQERSSILFDHFLASSLGEWFAYPTFLLPYEVFFNLLISKTIYCSRSDFFFYMPKEDLMFEKNPRRKELDELLTNGKLRFIDIDPYVSSSLEKKNSHKRVMEHVKKMRDHEFRSNRHRSSKITNLTNLLYCSGNKLPLRLSIESAAEALEIGSLCIREGLISETFEEGTFKSLNTILKWVFQVEVPALEARTAKTITKWVDSQKKSICGTTGEQKSSEEFLRSRYYNDRVLISPEELIELLSDKETLTVLQDFLVCAATHNLTEAETRDAVREEWDKMLGRLTISEWTFTGINIATSPLPFSGAATALGQLGVNKYLKKSSNWLLSLNEFNKKVRESRQNDNLSIDKPTVD